MEKDVLATMNMQQKKFLAAELKKPVEERKSLMYMLAKSFICFDDGTPNDAGKALLAEVYGAEEAEVEAAAPAPAPKKKGGRKKKAEATDTGTDAAE